MCKSRRRLDRLRQPRADVADAGPVRGAQQIEAAPGAGRGEPGGGLADLAVRGSGPFDEGILYRVLGIRPRSQDAVGQPQKAGAGLFKHAHGFGVGHFSAGRC